MIRNHYKCKNCLSENTARLFETTLFSIFRCNECNFYYKNVDECDYLNLAENDYICYNYNRMKEAIEIDRVIKKNLRTTRIKLLEIGSGTGSLLQALYNLGYEVIGVEPNESAVSMCKKYFPHIKVVCGFFSADKIKVGKVDTVLLYDVIEHLNPQNSLYEEIQRYMDRHPETLLIVKSGNPMSFNAKLFLSHWRYILIPEHISFYSQEALKIFCERRSLSLIKFYGFKHAYGGIHISKILKNVMKAIFKKIYIDKLLKRDFSIELANDHFIAVIKKNI